MSRTTLVSVVRRALRGLGLPKPGQRFLTALSGGADSVALLDVLQSLTAEMGFELVAAHLDHGLRPDSATDAVFCQRLCDELGVALVSGRADVTARAARERGGIEQAARRERYAFLRRVRAEQGAAYVAVAHTRDDQAETVLLHLLRGSGARGLSAMRPRQGRLVRPLLEASRQAVLQHLGARGLAWREDLSNRDTSLARNRVRHELLPLLERRYSANVRARLARTAALLRDDDRALELRAAALFTSQARFEQGGVLLPVRMLRQAAAPLARRVLRRALRSTGGLRGVAAIHVARILGLAHTDAPSGHAVSLPGRRTASFRFEHLFVGPQPAAAQPFDRSLAVPGQVELPDGRVLTARLADEPLRREAGVAVLPLVRPLLVRSRQAGDRVSVRGRRRSLKRLLMEARVPAEERGGWPVVSAGGQIVWVPGLELGPSAFEPGAPGLVRLELAHERRPEARP